MRPSRRDGRRQIERARYDADLGERRYEAIDPANRLIAATLERLNDALQWVLDLEAEMAGFERQTLRAVTAEQKQQIMQLGRDFPRLWCAPTTSPRDGKRMLRLPIKDITVAQGAGTKAGQIAHPLAGRGDRDGRIPPVAQPGRLAPLSAGLHRGNPRSGATHDDREIAALLALGLLRIPTSALQDH
ncbi:hypothetical protein [Mesorhizobium cantuariense]|uniref:Transposase n=1 Tax=Mesorhizobium cantuariense TaxID=1300275 RepID=A0ABV7MW38_9HYPH